MKENNLRNDSTTTYVVFDLETTGLSPKYHTIIQIAAVRISDGVVQEHDNFHSYANPEQKIPAFIQAYTGITDADVRHAPAPADVIQRFADYSRDSVLIAHNGHRFDMKFIRAVCEAKGLRTRPAHYLDSISFSKQLWGTKRGTRHGMDPMLARLKISTGGCRRHNAQGDVQLLARAVTKMWHRLSGDFNTLPVAPYVGVLPTKQDRQSSEHVFLRQQPTQTGTFLPR